MVFFSLLLFRFAQPKTTEEQSRQIFEKGSRIEQEFAEYFTGEEEGIDLVNPVQILLANCYSPLYDCFPRFCVTLLRQLHDSYIRSSSLRPTERRGRNRGYFPKGAP